MPNMMRALSLLAFLVGSAVHALPSAQSIPVGTVVGLEPVTNTSLGIRHCHFVVSATPITPGNEDFQFTLIAALNGQANAYSFQSVNYPDYYLSIIDGQQPGFAERGRLGIIQTPDHYNASWMIVPGLADPTQFSITSLSQTPMFTGKYITLSKQISGPCKDAPPSGDIYVDAAGAGVTQTFRIGGPPPPPPATMVVDTSATDHQMNPHFMGCHIDPGYTQQPRFWYSNLVYGESFEKGTTSVYAWNPYTANGVSATVKLDTSVLFNPNKNTPTLSINYQSGSGAAGWSNRGIGNEGMSIVGGQVYDGYVFILAPQGAQLWVAVNDYVSNKLLDSTTISVPASAGWQKIDFTLTPSANSTCNGIVPGSNPFIDCGKLGPNPGHICIQCSGEFQVGLAGTGSANIGYVFFEPGPWGRFNNQPVLLSAVQTMQQMGVTLIRQGGTVSRSFTWKDWRGVPWQRGSMQHVWGDSLVSGWGPFEFVDMANGAGIIPIVTLAYDTNSVQDWADLVEYCWGDASTTWGSVRIVNDTHPAPYNITIWELGNEQYNPDFVQQVIAMEAKRTAIGAPAHHYMFPTNQGLNAADAQAAVKAGLPIPMIMPDCHVGGGGGVECAEKNFNNPPIPNFPQSGINVETNDGISTMERAIHEASDLQDWFNTKEPVLHRLVGRAASFCSERSGHYDAFDQGISFFLPNMTWLQPPGFVHAMVTQTWLPNSLNVSINGFPAGSSQISNDGKTLNVQLVNPAHATGAVNVTLTGGFVPSASPIMWTLTNDNSTSGNTPYQPGLISPQQSTLTTWAAGSASGNVPMPAYSFIILQFQG